jgi:hypothetical protein
MILRSLTSAHARRFQGVLEHYHRPELRLRVTHVFKLEGQPDQVTFEPVDAAGRVLRDGAGITRRHTFEVAAPLTRLRPSQLVSVARDGEGVRLQVMSNGH